MTITEHRNTRFKLAIITSLGSKCATLVLQLLVLPLAVRTLGPALFGVYSMLVASLNWIWSCGVGIGPSLTIATAHAVKDGNQSREARYVSTAFHIICLICMLLVLGFSVITHYIGIGDIFGDQYLIYAHDIRLGISIISGMLMSILLLGVVEGAMAGHQEQYIINFCAMLGNICSAAVLLVVLLRAPSVIGMILCMTCVAYLPRVLIAITYVVFIRPHWTPKLRSFDFATAKLLLGTGAAFSIMQIAQFMKHEMGILFVGRILGPVAVAGYAILINICLLGFGVVTMQTQPLLPAITDAAANGDYTWIRRIGSRGLRYVMIYACLAGLMLAGAGNTIICIWYGPTVAQVSHCRLQSGPHLCCRFGRCIISGC